MSKTALKDTYFGGTTLTELQNEVSTCQQLYYDKETKVIVNQTVNEFTHFSSLKLMHNHKMSFYYCTSLQPSLGSS